MSDSRTENRTENTAPWAVLGLGLLLLVIGGLALALEADAKAGPPDWAIIMAIAGVGIAIGGGIWIYDASPLPDEVVRAPQPLQLVQDEPWRTNTGLRYLEMIKEVLLGEERQLAASYGTAKHAYETLPHSAGRIEYNRLRKQKSAAEAEMARWQKEVASSKERIELIVRGQVDPEIFMLREEIKKFERNKQEEQRVFVTWETPCTVKHTNQIEESLCERKRWKAREAILHKIHEIDFRVIELQGQEEELKSYDFKNLWKQLGHSAVAASGLTAVDKHQLQDMKDKAEILKSMPMLKTAAIQLSPEEERRKREQQIETRLKRHEQNKRDALKGIMQGRQFDQLSADEQDDYREEENSWAEILHQDREELRKAQR